MTAAISPSATKDGRETYQIRTTSDDSLPRFKMVTATLNTSTTENDTVAINIAESLGMTKILAVSGWYHTTENQVIVPESVGSASTTAMVNNTLTISVNGVSTAAKRTYNIYGI